MVYGDTCRTTHYTDVVRNTETSEFPVTVLVADDDPISLAIIEAKLSSWGYELLIARNGLEAWELLTTKAPDLALLDWEMPGINGPALCKRIKNSDLVTYSILLTVKDETDDMVEGLVAGADDFITKPFIDGELKSRMEAGKRIAGYERRLIDNSRRLKEYANKMEALAENRARQLVHSDRMATLGVLAAGIAHEINNPTTYIGANVEILEQFWEEIQKSLLYSASNGKGDAHEIKSILTETPEMLTEIRSGVGRISKIVKGLRSYSSKDDKRCECSLKECILNSLRLCRSALIKNAAVCLDLDELKPLEINGQQIEQVLVNLLTNAADAIAPGTGKITVSLKSVEPGIQQIVFEDTGPGFPQANAELIFTPFFTTKESDRGTGLGLSISQGIIENHDGTIRAESPPEGGARFIIKIPE